jgi:hypothetical protein
MLGQGENPTAILADRCNGADLTLIFLCRDILDGPFNHFPITARFATSEYENRGFSDQRKRSRCRATHIVPAKVIHRTLKMNPIKLTISKEDHLRTCRYHRHDQLNHVDMKVFRKMTLRTSPDTPSYR